MSTLVVSVILTSLAGNGSVLAILARFKALRTFPNILLANLVLVDFLCALVNMPLFLSCYVLEADEFDEETLALAACFLQYGFTILNLASISAMLLDRFLAVYMDFRYYVWKTKKKAVVSAALIWLFSSFSVVLTIQPALDVELTDDSSHLEYRWLIYQAREPYITFTVTFFILSAVGLGIMTTFAIRQKKTQVFIWLVYFTFTFFFFFFFKKLKKKITFFCCNKFTILGDFFFYLQNFSNSLTKNTRF